ncbi:HpcH/HpaI aldolase/citrate lyase family protein [Sulfitobacter geojensis]|nr:CoA ester lyase [Sulfitobacter geojensis]KHA54063.1 HpcH/HpaI aldolase [Sulfitobacter geojensis]
MDKIDFPLFLPATRLERLAKAVTSGADAVIIDLEDSVNGDQKDAMRQAVETTLAGTEIAVPLILRINDSNTSEHAKDILACKDMRLDAIMLPKAENPDDCKQIAARTGKPVIALIESARGLANANSIAASCARMAFGSIDYAADLGIAHEGHALLHARANLVLAARLAGQTPPIDGVTAEIQNMQKIITEGRHGREMGFRGKLLIHPAQIRPAREGFTPTDEEVSWASRVMASAAQNNGVANVDGAMVDAPVIKQAQSILDTRLST